MISDKFLRIEQRGGNPVAVFVGLPVFHEHYEDGQGYYDDGTFCLNYESLLTRAQNLERAGRDPQEERLGLLLLGAEQRRLAGSETGPVLYTGQCQHCGRLLTEAEQVCPEQHAAQTGGKEG